MRFLNQASYVFCGSKHFYSRFFYFGNGPCVAYQSVVLIWGPAVAFSGKDDVKCEASSVSVIIMRLVVNGCTIVFSEYDYMTL